MEELGDFEEFEFDTIEDEVLVELNQVEDLRLLIIVFSYF